MNRIFRWAMLVVTIGWCLFIWHFSLADGNASAATSGEVMNIVNEALTDAGAENPITHTMIRKIGHFIEFFALGFLAALTFLSHDFHHFLPYSVATSFIVGGVDEILQIFVPGRGPSFADVALDTVGGACGALFLCLVALMYCVIRDRLRKKSEINQKTS